MAVDIALVPSAKSVDLGVVGRDPDLAPDPIREILSQLFDGLGMCVEVEDLSEQVTLGRRHHVRSRDEKTGFSDEEPSATGVELLVLLGPRVCGTQIGRRIRQDDLHGLPVDGRRVVGECPVVDHLLELVVESLPRTRGDHHVGNRESDIELGLNQGGCRPSYLIGALRRHRR